MITRLIQSTGDFLARYSGLPVLLAAGLIILNFVLQLLPETWFLVGWLAETDFLLHLGLVIGLIGGLLGDVL